MSEHGRRSGFLALPREAQDSAHPYAWFPGDPIAAQLYVLYASRARWNDATEPPPKAYGRSEPVKTGQLIIGTQQIAKETARSRQQVRAANHRLTNGYAKINQQSNQRNTLITVIDYDKLFLFWPDSQPTEQPSDNQQKNQRQPHQNNEPGKPENKSPHLYVAPPLPPVGEPAPDGATKKKKVVLVEEVRIGRKVWSGVPDRNGKPGYVPWDTLDPLMQTLRELHGIEVLRHVERMAENDGPGVFWRQKFDEGVVRDLCRQVSEYLSARSSARGP